MKELRVETRVKNNRLYRLIMEHNPSVTAFGKAVGIRRDILYGLLSFRIPAYDGWQHNQLPTDLAQRIAAALGKPVEYVFPVQLCSQKTNSFRSVEIGIEHARRISQYSVAPKELGWDNPSKTMVKTCVEETLSEIPEREAKVIKLRFGFGDDAEPMSLREVAKKLRVTTERIRQIEAKAIRRLRHPTRSEGLRPLLEPHL